MSAEALSRFYDDVILPNFAPNELMPRADFLHGFGGCGTQSHGVFAIDAEGSVVGGLVAEWFASSRVVLLAYLAVRPALRGRGIAHQIASVAAPLLSSLKPTLVVAEVEDPNFHASSRAGEPMARLRLFAELGGQVLLLPYFQPRLDSHLDRVQHLLLLVFSIDDSVIVRRQHKFYGPVDAVDGSIIDDFLVEYFTMAEGSLPRDEEFEQLRSLCQASMGVPLLPIFESPRVAGHSAREASDGSK